MAADMMKAALRVAGKRIKLLGQKQLNANLEFCGDLAEAYQVGVEEAQGEIIARLLDLQAKARAITSVNPTHQHEPTCPCLRGGECNCDPTALNRGVAK